MQADRKPVVQEGVIHMEITIELQSERIAVVHLTGKLDIFSTAEVKQRLSQTVTGGAPHLIIDLEAVVFVDSSGLAALISGLKTARLASGDLCVARPGAEIQTILEFTRLDRVISVYPTIEAALAACS